MQVLDLVQWRYRKVIRNKVRADIKGVRVWPLSLPVMHRIATNVQIEISNHHPFPPTGIGDDLPIGMDDSAVTIILSIPHQTYLMRARMCFTVVVGNVDPTDEKVKEAFFSHTSKFETAMLWWLFFNIPIFQISLRRELTELEARELKKISSSIDENFKKNISKLRDLRTKGIYV